MKGIILLANNFEDVEAITTIDLLKRAGIMINTVSMNNEKLVNSKYGLNIKCEMQIDEIEILEYDFLIIPGGAAVMEHLKNQKTLNTVMQFEKQQKLIAAICAAPSILGKLGLLDNEDFVCFPGFESYMKGNYKPNEKVVVSNNHITSKAAGTTMEFAGAIIEYLKDTKTKESVYKEIFYN